MSLEPNTLFLRLEGPLQAWGTNDSKFGIRRSYAYPTRSGVSGLICSALGCSRAEAGTSWLPRMLHCRMGIRIDRPGYRWWDYHTVGAGMKMPIAEAPPPSDGRSDPQKPKVKTKPGAMLTRREYLADASFLVALQGEPDLISILAEAIAHPKWTLYLGRKSCPPATPILACPPEYYPDLLSALKSPVLAPLRDATESPEPITLIRDWAPVSDEEPVPDTAFICYDLPQSFEPPRHLPRVLVREELPITEFTQCSHRETVREWLPARKRANYGSTAWADARDARLRHDSGICVLCKSPANTVHHTSYDHKDSAESIAHLRTLCRLCHDSVTMIEYSSGMGSDRIDPCDPEWRKAILKKRAEIVQFRSLEARRRKITTEED